MPETAAEYPVRLDVRHPAHQRRLTNFPLLIGNLVRLTLLLPHLLLLLLLLPAQVTAFLLASFGILITGRYPLGLFRLQQGILRWSTNVTAYLLHLFDDYPPMDLQQRDDWYLRLDVDYPRRPSRWLNLPVLGPLLKIVLLIPHLLALAVLQFLAGVVVFIAEFAIVFAGVFPAGLHRLVAGCLRWQTRVTAYLLGFTDKYPPFRLG